MAEIVITTPDSKETVELTELPFTIGRQSDNNYSFDDPQLSRKHCSIRLSDGEFMVEDLGSKNGTFVNGVEIEQTALTDGDRIRIGELNIRFHHTADETVPAVGPSEPPQSRRLVRWINPFQVSSSTSDANGYGTGVLLSVCCLLLLVGGGVLLVQPLRSEKQVDNLLGASGETVENLTHWQTAGATLEPIEQENQVFRLSLSTDQPEASLRHTPTIPVRPSSRYVLSARISTRNLTGFAGAHVKWLGSDDVTLYEELVLPTRSQNDWAHVSSRPLQPPAGADRMELSFFASGQQGIVLVDDPVLRTNSGSGAPDARFRHTFSQFPFAIDKSGQLQSTNSSGGRLLQSGLRFWTDGRRSRGWTMSLMNRRQQNSSTTWSCTAFAPMSYEAIHFTVSLQSDPPRITHSLPSTVRNRVDQIGFQFQYRPGNADDRIQVVTGEERIALDSNSAYSDVRGLVFPVAPGPVLVQFSRPLSLQTSTDRNDTRSLVVTLPLSTDEDTTGPSGTDAIELGYSLHPSDHSIQSISRASEQTPADVRALVESGEYEKALSLLKKLKPFERLRRNGTEFEHLHSRFIERIEGTVQRIREDLRTAQELGSRVFLKSALDQLEILRKRLGSHQDQWSLSDLEQKLKHARDQIGEGNDENQVGELYDTFILYRDAGRKTLARQVATDILEHAPDTKAGREARSYLEEFSEPDKTNKNGNRNSN